jgi:hypothetical protein
MRFKKFLDKFPPPEFLDVPFTAIVFSDSNLRVLSLNKVNMHPEISLEIALEEGVIEAGVIKKPEELVKTLSEIRGKLKTPFVKFAVPDEISYVFTSKVPAVQDKDAREAVSFILEENVPLPLSDIYFDFTPIRVESGEASSLNMVVAAVSGSIIEGYVAALKSAGFAPIFCTNESQCIARAIVPADSKENACIIYIHRNAIGIYMTEGDSVEFSSTAAIPPDSSKELLTSFVNAELRKSIAYWRERVGKNKSEDEIKCFLCGKFDECKSILDNSSRLTGVEMSLGNVWVNTFSLEDYIPEISFEDSLRFAGAVGLTL